MNRIEFKGKEKEEVEAENNFRIKSTKPNELSDKSKIQTDKALQTTNRVKSTKNQINTKKNKNINSYSINKGITKSKVKTNIKPISFSNNNIDSELILKSRIPNNYNNPFNYEIISKIGKGKYSEVYLSYNIVSQENYVLKIIKKTSSLKKILREIKILNELNKAPNIVVLKEVIVYNEITILVFEYSEYDTFSNYYNKLNSEETKKFLYDLITNIEYSHSKGIFHRDIKPSNLIYNKEEGKLIVIDWGMAEYYNKSVKYPCSISTKGYKAPEVLVNYQYYDLSVDIWCFGLIMACLIFRIKSLFRPCYTDTDNLKEIVNLLGTEDLLAFVNKYCIVFRSSALLGNKSKLSFKSFIREDNKDLCSDEAIDLLSKLLVYDIRKRLTAKEIIEHKYFDNVRR